MAAEMKITRRRQNTHGNSRKGAKISRKNQKSNLQWWQFWITETNFQRWYNDIQTVQNNDWNTKMSFAENERPCPTPTQNNWQNYCCIYTELLRFVMQNRIIRNIFRIYSFLISLRISLVSGTVAARYLNFETFWDDLLHSYITALYVILVSCYYHIFSFSYTYSLLDQFIKM